MGRKGWKNKEGFILFLATSLILLTKILTIMLYIFTYLRVPNTGFLRLYVGHKESFEKYIWNFAVFMFTFSTFSSAYFEKDSLSFPFVCAILQLNFPLKMTFCLWTCFWSYFFSCFWGQKNITNFVSIARLIQNNPMFSCAILLSLFLTFWDFAD